MTAEYRTSASTVVEDFDAALVFVARQVAALHLAQPSVTIQPFRTPAAQLMGIEACSYHVCVSGPIPAPIVDEVSP